VALVLAIVVPALVLALVSVGVLMQARVSNPGEIRRAQSRKP
jgi:hypothetical protein